MSNKPTLELVPKPIPATVAEIAQVEFRALKEFRNLTKAERLDKIQDAAERVRTMALLASEIVTKEKPELIALVAEQYAALAPFLIQLGHAGTAARSLVDVIVAGEARLVVALANVEDDEFAARVAEEAGS